MPQAPPRRVGMRKWSKHLWSFCQGMVQLHGCALQDSHLQTGLEAGMQTEVLVWKWDPCAQHRWPSTVRDTVSLPVLSPGGGHEAEDALGEGDT